MFDDCTKTICSIEKKDAKYIFKDCDGKDIWDTDKSNLEFSNALGKKTIQYIKACQGTGFASDNQMVWMLVIKTVNAERFYKNIAVCKYFRYAMGEINEHIKQLVGIIQDMSTKTKRYKDLWSDEVSEIEFIEVNIDMYIENIRKQSELQKLQKSAPYIYSLISMKETDTTISSKKILRKNQAEFIEGKIANDYDMKKNGIWNPSSLGIDGEIYSYYDNQHV